MIIPPYLKPGNTIGIAATARKVSPDEIETAIAAMKAIGLNVVLAANIYKEYHQFSGTDKQRANGFNDLIRNPEIQAIWIARGGYGSVRVIDQIDWASLKKHPKWICGFSDVTALHSHLNHMVGMASIHAEMMVGYADNTDAAHHSLHNALFGAPNKYQFLAHHLNRKGNATGELVGGNLSVLYSLLGSPSQLKTDGKILFIEDLDEYLYHVDRMMMALKRAGMLSQLKALVVGGMSAMNDNTIPFGKTAEEIIHDVVAEYDYPVYFGLPAGHLADNRALILGAQANIRVAEKTVTFWQD